MRTTVTLDADVEALLQVAMREQQISFEQALNAAVRAGLTRSSERVVGFLQSTFHLGSEQNFRWDKALASAAALEDEQLLRKLSLRK